jgi:hypothetical protein
MTFTRAWINFKRMHDSAALCAVLIYAAAVLHAFQILPGETSLKVQRTLVWPGAFLLLSLALVLLVAPLRRWLMRFMWVSFATGFGQTPISILTHVGILLGASLFIYWQVAAAPAGGRYPAGVFSAYAAGIGLLIAQARLARGLEREPDVRAVIQEREPL